MHILRISHPLTNRRIISPRLQLLIQHLFLAILIFTIFLQIIASRTIHHISHHLELDFYMMPPDFYISVNIILSSPYLAFKYTTPLFNYVHSFLAYFLNNLTQYFVYLPNKYTKWTKPKPHTP